MFIKQITLENIKSYGSEPTTIEFGDGVNLIAGENGAGKSTIVEAIGFALFDALPYSQNEFERRGGSGPSRVIVRVVSAFDDREYDIERVIGRAPKITDTETNLRQNVANKGDLIDWLHQHLCIDDGVDLSALFDNAVGVQQGTMTAIFLDSPGNRKSTFDSLLQVQDYENAWYKLRETSGFIDNLISENRTSLAEKRGEIKHLPEREEKARDVEISIAHNEEERNRLSAMLDKITDELGVLDEQKARLDKLNSQIEQADKRIKELDKQLQDATLAIQEAKSARQLVHDNAEAHLLYEEAESLLVELEAQRIERDKLRDEQRDAQSQLDLAKQALTTIEHELENVQTAEEQIAALSPLVDQQDALEAQLADAKRNQEEYTRLLSEIEQSEEKLAKIEQDLRELSAQVERRKTLVRELEQLEADRGEVIAQMEQLKIEREALSNAVDAAQEALKEAAKQLDAHQKLEEAIEEAQRQLSNEVQRKSEIERELDERQKLTTAIEECTTAINAATEQKTSDEATLEHVESEELTALDEKRELLGKEDAVCPVCQRPFQGDEHQEAIRYYDKEESRLNEIRQQATAQIKKAESILAEKNRELNSLQADRDKLAAEAMLTEIEGRITDTKQAISENQASLEGMSNVTEDHQRAENKLQQAKKELAEHDDRVDALSNERQELTEKIEKHQKDIAELATPAQLDQRQQNHDELAGQIEKNTQRINELANVDERIEELVADLTELGDPRSRLAVAREIANKREEFESKQATETENLEKATERLTQANTSLQQYEGLDQEIEAKQQQRDDNREGHQAYIANENIAKQLEAREQKLTEVSDQFEQESDEQSERLQERDQIAAEYDTEQHEKRKQESDDLKQDRAELDGTVASERKNLEDLQREIAELRAIAEEIKTLEAVAEKLQERKEAFNFVREGIRKAGPRIRKRKVQLVEQAANDVFQRIMNDFNQRLMWDSDDYGITVEKAGETRSFNVLSGGEQMIAALSVRLALLIHMTQVRAVFLDEPTVNLDENRRIQLAERLGQIEGLQQLFVISHDDTFETNCDHVILIAKENDVSKVGNGHAIVR